MSEPAIKNFTVPLNRFELTPEMKKFIPYTAELEFEQLKRVRETVDFRLSRQQDLIDKIKRGKFKVSMNDLPAEMVLALAKKDLEILQQTRAYFEARRCELRRKIHEEALNGSRSDPDDDDDEASDVIEDEAS